MPHSFFLRRQPKHSKGLLFRCPVPSKGPSCNWRGFDTRVGDALALGTSRQTPANERVGEPPKKLCGIRRFRLRSRVSTTVSTDGTPHVGSLPPRAVSARLPGGDEHPVVMRCQAGGPLSHAQVEQAHILGCEAQFLGSHREEIDRGPMRFHDPLIGMSGDAL